MSTTISLATKERTGPSLQVNVGHFSIDIKDGAFRLTTPSFDDWLQTQDFDLRQAEATIHVDFGKFVISFPNADSRAQFATWLAQANTNAQKGYRTMWP